MNRRSLLKQTLAAGAVLTVPALPASADPASAKALVTRYVALKNAHDAEHCGEIFRTDYIERSGRTPSGLDALVANWKAQFEAIPDLVITLEDTIVDGDKAVARMTYAGTHTRTFAGLPPTGRGFRFGTIDIWRVQDGKFAEHWDQVDFAGIARQLKS